VILTALGISNTQFELILFVFPIFILIPFHFLMFFCLLVCLALFHELSLLMLNLTRFTSFFDSSLRKLFGLVSLMSVWCLVDSLCRVIEQIISILFSDVQNAENCRIFYILTQLSDDISPPLETETDDDDEND
ncbi:hypothetical protein BpHYR1_051438, partial [Brachionus plicatilis]